MSLVGMPPWDATIGFTRQEYADLHNTLHFLITSRRNFVYNQAASTPLQIDDDLEENISFLMSLLRGAENISQRKRNILMHLISALRALWFTNDDVLDSNAREGLFADILARIQDPDDTLNMAMIAGLDDPAIPASPSARGFQSPRRMLRSDSESSGAGGSPFTPPPIYRMAHGFQDTSSAQSPRYNPGSFEHSPRGPPLGRFRLADTSPGLSPITSPLQRRASLVARRRGSSVREETSPGAQTPPGAPASFYANQDQYTQDSTGPSHQYRLAMGAFGGGSAPARKSSSGSLRMNMFARSNFGAGMLGDKRRRTDGSDRTDEKRARRIQDSSTEEEEERSSPLRHGVKRRGPRDFGGDDEDSPPVPAKMRRSEQKMS